MARGGETIGVAVASNGDGLPDRVSPSQVATFGSCQLRYYFGTVLGWREPASRASAAGVLVHDVLEQLFRLPAPDRTPPRGQVLLRERAVHVLGEGEYAAFREDRDVADTAVAALRNAFTVEDPCRVEVADTDLEAEVTADLGGVSFGGRIDRRTGGPVPRITDYKSGAKPPPAYLQDKLRQLYLYAAADLASGGHVTEVELLYLGGGGARVRRPVFDAVIDDAVASLVTMRTRAQAALSDATFQARRSPLCRYCSFQRACPQFAADASAPGSPESDQSLAGAGLLRRHRPRPEPLDRLVDTDGDEP